MSKKQKKPLQANIDVPQKSNSYRSVEKPVSRELLYGKKNFIIIAIGIAIMLVGYFFMTGGAMSNENEWKEDVIYSFTRITLSPLLILCGLGVIGYSIFAPNSSSTNTDI